MNKLIVYEYMKRIKHSDIVRFANNQGVKLMDYEIDIIHDYIKNNYKNILSNPQKVLEDAKKLVSNCTYLKLLELYDKYKDKISQF